LEAVKHREFRMQTKSQEHGSKGARVDSFLLHITQECYELWQHCSCHQCGFHKCVQLHHPTHICWTISLQSSQKQPNIQEAYNYYLGSMSTEQL